MKSKFKLGDFLLLFGTLLVFMLSIVLWIFIMTNDQYFSRINQTSTVTQQSHNRFNNSVYDLYIPTASYGFEKGQLYRLYDAKKNIPLEFTKELKEIKYRQINKNSSSRTKYEELLHNSNYVQLTFPDEIGIKLFTGKDTHENQPKFRRVFVSTSNHYLYLGDDRTYTVYRVTFAKANFNKLRSYARNAYDKTPVKFVRLKDCYEVFYTKAERWRIYSYLTNTQTDSYFVSRLLGTTNVTTHTSKKGWITYSLNYYTKLRAPKANTKRHNFLYTRYEKSKMLQTNKQLRDSVAYVHKLGLSEQDLRFFDTNGETISYINYIEGLPVFLGQHTPQVNTIFTPESTQIAFENIDLQIPIPFDGQTQTLPATSDIMQQLVDAGLKREQIQRIVVAFRLVKDNSHNHLANLIPTYYVKAYNRWQNLDEWKKQDLRVLNKVNNQQEGQ